MGHSGVSIRPIQPGQWRTYREVRLRALQDTPDAFGSTFAAEAARPDDLWALRVAEAWASGHDKALFAWDGDTVCGLAWCKRSATEPGMADLFQMWVAPQSRGRGVGAALLREVVAHARGAGATTLRLGVTVAESPAMRLYRAFGFRPVGQPEPLREGSGLIAQTMHLDLYAD
ncbi:GNAT family N-acetyltransferase [Ideonella sp. A 288]|uniref:GNAT family N-acetyltransferase n=1 Tax=Ideonella sp. A 288 TaxID=1962181 RepID=UPI000B4B2111|nr:GNAT family N-acetyltransferase [Ideonella sp. A 288]